MGGAAQDGYTALIWAAHNGRADCVRLLLDAGAEKNATNNVRATAGVACIGAVVEMDWCAKGHLHFCFRFCYIFTIVFAL